MLSEIKKYDVMMVIKDALKYVKKLINVLLVLSSARYYDCFWAGEWISCLHRHEQPFSRRKS